MDAERYRRLRELFERASKLAPGERARFLLEVCPEEQTRREVQELLDIAEAEATVLGADGGRKVPPGVDPDATVSAHELGPRATPGVVRVGPYRLLRKLGEGGMGVVWEARQERPVERTVALKLVRADLDAKNVLARFESERQALALMNHPNIARVLDSGTDDLGRPYFAMEYIRGVSITDYCDRHNLATRERLGLMIQVCEGVHHAHQKGILHRDLKPSNVLVEVQGGAPVPKIIDFGVAKAVDRNLTERTLFTEFGQLVGTPEYMSPEQAEMSGLDVDTRTDVYSLGVMLYEILTGVLPFDAREMRRRGYDEIRRVIREETPPRPSTRLSTLGDAARDVARHRGADPPSLVRLCRGDLDWITMKALEKDRTRRYGAASDLAADLRRHLANEPVSAGPPSAGYRLRKFVRRHRVGVGVAAALALTAFLGLAGTTYGLVRSVAAERRVRLEAEALAEVSDFMVRMFEISDPGEARGNTVTAREILDRARDRIRGELGDRPEVRQRLLDSMGRVYRSLGLYTDARPLLEEAITAAERAYGADDPRVATSLSALAGLLIQRGQADEAEALLRRALAIQEREIPAGPDLARTLNNLGNVERLRKRYAEALPWYEKAYSIRERALGPDHAEVARMLTQIGWVHLQTGELDEARAVFQRAVAMFERTLGPDHPELARALNTLAQIERKARRPEAAREAATRSMAILEKTLDPWHPDLVNAWYERAMIERDAGDLDAAQAAIERAAAIAERTSHRLAGNVADLRRELLAASARDGTGGGPP